MDFTKALENIKKGQIQAVYTLVGDEPYLKETLLKSLDEALSFSGQEVETARLDYQEYGLASVIEEANTFSFFSDKRLIIVESADFISTKAKKKLSKGEEKLLYAYLDNPNPGSVLVFTCPDKPDNRKKLTKELKNKTVWLDILEISEKQVENYLSKALQSKGLSLSNEAFGEFLFRVDFDLTMGMQETEKLAVYAYSGDKITVDVIKNLVPRTLGSDVFELSDAVIKGNYQAAIQIYEDLLLLRNEPIALHALLVSQFRVMLQTKLCLSKGMNQNQAASELKIHPYRVKLAVQSGRNISLRDLAELYNELAEADYKMKTGVGERESHFYILLTRLMEKYE